MPSRATSNAPPRVSRPGRGQLTPPGSDRPLHVDRRRDRTSATQRKQWPVLARFELARTAPWTEPGARNLCPFHAREGQLTPAPRRGLAPALGPRTARAGVRPLQACFRMQRSRGLDRILRWRRSTTDKTAWASSATCGISLRRSQSRSMWLSGRCASAHTGWRGSCMPCSAPALSV
jgi:hypothetical protein